MRRLLVMFLALAVWLAGFASGVGAQEAKNVFVMIADGASFGTWDAADLAQHGRTTASPYYAPQFRKYLMTTYPLNTSSTPTGNLTPQVGYYSAAAWGLRSYDTPSGYLHQHCTDSAAAGTAMSTGRKTFNNALNWANDDQAIRPTICELAKQAGKVVGTISSVQWSHATPAAFSHVHNISRNNYAAIAQEMLNGSTLDVIMGAGHPQFDDDGRQTVARDDEVTDDQAKFVGGRECWLALQTGSHAGGWTAVEEKSDFEALARGDLSVLAGKTRLVGTVQVARSLQVARTGYAPTDRPFDDAMISSLPTLEVMTRAAINVLSSLDAGHGMFLHIEGGAVDWAAHQNATARTVEEMVDFNQAVACVISWIEDHGGWDENLLIITTDHGNGMPMGPQSDVIPHARIKLEDVYAGQYVADVNEQGMRWWTTGHTNELVPLFAQGVGADFFDSLIDGIDPYFGIAYGDWAGAGFDGRYVDNTDVFTVTRRVVAASTSAYSESGRSSPAQEW